MAFAAQFETLPAFSTLGVVARAAAAALLLLLLPQASAQPSSSPQPSRALPGFPAESIDNVVVPVPSEVFNVLDKLGPVNWRAHYRASPGRNTGSRPQVALLLGTIIAEGFVAVEAEDPEKVKEIGRDVLTLSEAIGVREAVIARAKSITDKADRRRWPEVRRELDGALQDVRAAMRELNDEDLAQLVSLGGWIRGTHVLTSITLEQFQPEKAGLLHQPELIDYFQRRIEQMPKRLREDALVTRVRSALQKIRPLVEQKNDTPISEQNVKTIHQLSSETLEAITANPS